jgi:serine-type D-Ala-D-Ala carboxypeptidase/endopeptidase (penicillin-binding protein 4)
VTKNVLFCQQNTAVRILSGVCVLFLFMATPAPAFSFGPVAVIDGMDRFSRHLGPDDALLVTTANGHRLAAINADRPLVPASTLKMLTALVALKVLGPSFRFPTEIYLSGENDLVVKGYGDPLLVSEALAEMAAMLDARLGPGERTIRNLVVDDHYFSTPVTIPGVHASIQPYDAPNGALCANFNTVSFKTEGGRRVSAEPQTPLLAFAEKRISRTRASEGRITLSHEKGDIPIYAGRLFRHFLDLRGIAVSGTVRRNVDRSRAPVRVLRYLSAYPLTRVVQKMLAFSNNFMANQLLIAAGAAEYGAPGNLEKGIRAAMNVAGRLGIENLVLVEGSGISRKNRIRAQDLDRVMKAFAPYASLMRTDGPERYKTGTLAGIRTRAGYIQVPGGSQVRYVILINTPGIAAGPVIRELRSILLGQAGKS